MDGSRHRPRSYLKTQTLMKKIVDLHPVDLLQNQKVHCRLSSSFFYENLNIFQCYIFQTPGMICFSAGQRHFTCFRSAIEGSRVFLDFAAMKLDPVHRYEVWAFKKTRF